MAYFTDQTGRQLHLDGCPRRIVSLVPSQTELLAALALDEEVAGITKFCIHPDKWFRTKPRVGGTKTLDIEKIRQLKPELILANKEENTREQVLALSADYPVWVSDVEDLDNAIAMISETGKLTCTTRVANGLAGLILQRFSALGQFLSQRRSVPAAYLIWKDPIMVAGGDTFIHDMMKRCGFVNVFGHLFRYPTMTTATLREAGCDVVLLSSEPYPFKEKDRTEMQHELPGSRVLLADGTYFSWYGSRLADAPDYFMRLRDNSGLF